VISHRESDIAVGDHRNRGRSPGGGVGQTADWW
jgi:hypothetical protein